MRQVVKIVHFCVFYTCYMCVSFIVIVKKYKRFLGGFGKWNQNDDIHIKYVFKRARKLDYIS